MSTAVTSITRNLPPLPELTPEETALLAGDLSKLSAEQRANLITSVCRSLGLNPLTQPFAYITLNSKLTLYTKKDATDQLRKLHGVSVISTEHQLLNDVLFVTVKVQDRTGRIDQDMGAVNVANLRGEALANAYMKALTKGKRRATLSICGLGILDDSEVDSIPNAVRIEEVEPAQLPQHAPTEPATTEQLYQLQQLSGLLGAFLGTPITRKPKTAESAARWLGQARENLAQGTPLDPANVMTDAQWEALANWAAVLDDGGADAILSFQNEHGDFRPSTQTAYDLVKRILSGEVVS